jgi:DNA-binding response OmpR family regulator
MFLTVKTNIADKITGFSLGADDYIVKPFEPLELRARVEAKLSRRWRKSAQATEVINKGDLRISLGEQKAFLIINHESTDLGLTPIEFKLLYQFVTNEGKVLNRRQLMTSVWGKDISVEDRTIDRHISSLRKKLQKRARYIDSIYSLGYVFSLRQRVDKPTSAS